MSEEEPPIRKVSDEKCPLCGEFLMEDYDSDRLVRRLCLNRACAYFEQESTRFRLPRCHTKEAFLPPLFDSTLEGYGMSEQTILLKTHTIGLLNHHLTASGCVPKAIVSPQPMLWRKHI